MRSFAEQKCHLVSTFVSDDGAVCGFKDEKLLYVFFFFTTAELCRGIAILTSSEREVAAVLEEVSIFLPGAWINSASYQKE